MRLKSDYKFNLIPEGENVVAIYCNVAGKCNWLTLHFAAGAFKVVLSSFLENAQVVLQTKVFLRNGMFRSRGSKVVLSSFLSNSFFVFKPVFKIEAKVVFQKLLNPISSAINGAIEVVFSSVLGRRIFVFKSVGKFELKDDCKKSVLQKTATLAGVVKVVLSSFLDDAIWYAILQTKVPNATLSVTKQNAAHPYNCGTAFKRNFIIGTHAHG